MQQALASSREIIKKIRRRQLYKIAHEVLLDPLDAAAVFERVELVV